MLLAADVDFTIVVLSFAEFHDTPLNYQNEHIPKGKDQKSL
jgi:hypothetical protein